jgi:hypothetical protein
MYSINNSTISALKAKRLFPVSLILALDNASARFISCFDYTIATTAAIKQQKCYRQMSSFA